MSKFQVFCETAQYLKVPTFPPPLLSGGGGDRNSTELTFIITVVWKMQAYNSQISRIRIYPYAIIASR